MTRLLVFIFLFSTCSASVLETFSLYLDGSGKPVISSTTKQDDNVLVKAIYRQSYNETGWATLETYTKEDLADEKKAYYTGYLEGALTQELIYMHWFNTLGDYCNDRQDLCEFIDNFVSKNDDFINRNVRRNYFTNSFPQYWYQVKLFYEQLQGLSDGYIATVKDPAQNLTYKNLLWLNLQGDFEDLEQVFEAEKNNFEYTEPNPDFAGRSHCSALVKVLPDGSDILTAQDTWSSYQSMLRVLKKYDLKFSTTADGKDRIPGQVMTFSSYPGVITSGDDFYVISSGLVTLETTIGNSNPSIWKYVVPTSVLEGVRSTVANRLAIDGKSWADIFSRFNSGTYNNQWMIVNYNLFKPGTPKDKLPDGILYVVEQIPNLIRGSDLTFVLSDQGYWPSYNVPFSKAIFNMSGNQKMVEKFGDWFTYDKTPRALIFKRDHGKVTNMKTMMELMRYNDFRNDPLSKCDCQPPYSAENAIAARCDLNPANGTYPFSALGHRSHGATDAKITSQALLLQGLRFMAVSSPVYNDKDMPPFQWSKTDFKDTPHLGHPDIFKFNPIIFPSPVK